MNAFPFDMTFGPNPLREVNNLKDHGYGYTTLGGAWTKTAVGAKEQTCTMTTTTTKEQRVSGHFPFPLVGVIECRVRRADRLFRFLMSNADGPCARIVVLSRFLARVVCRRHHAVIWFGLDGGQRKSRRAKARSRKVPKPRGPRSQTPGLESPAAEADAVDPTSIGRTVRDVLSASPATSADDSSIHTASLQSFDLASIWSSDSDSTLGVHDDDDARDTPALVPAVSFCSSSSSSSSTSTPRPSSRPGSDPAAETDVVAPLTEDILAAFSLDEQLVSSPPRCVRRHVLGLCRPGGRGWRGSGDGDGSAGHGWSKTVGEWGAIGRVSEEEEGEETRAVTPVRTSEDERDDEGEALTIDEMPLFLADSFFPSPVLPPIPHSAPARAKSMRFLTLASTTTTYSPPRAEDSIHFFPVPPARSAGGGGGAHGRSMSEGRVDVGGVGLSAGWRRIASKSGELLLFPSSIIRLVKYIQHRSRAGAMRAIAPALLGPSIHCPAHRLVSSSHPHAFPTVLSVLRPFSPSLTLLLFVYYITIRPPGIPSHVIILPTRNDHETIRTNSLFHTPRRARPSHCCIQY
ncbi:hypothetical protein EW146_g1067 [Bondarzewia mesenterica]|uniref:Uncharacterized protein n=1 Tax=Bondarzewia mesenterica TaxID=1095465 RepID=A0A4S4M514_9AGAM|nr:hypothetical protein EW146_g1067 [Bondarzewia mesenterica]